MNNWEILGLKKGASEAEIKKKFRQLALIHHPDKGGDPKKFIQIKNAYDALLKGDSGEPQFSGGYGSGPSGNSRSQQRGYDQHDQRFWDEWQRQQQQGNARQQWEQQRAYQQQQRRRPAQFRFISIGKDSDGYVVKLFVDGVNTVEIYGKKGYLIAIYSVRGKYGEVRLGVNWKDAELAEYQFKIVLEDSDGYSATITYKVQPPFTKWEKIINKLKFWK